PAVGIANGCGLSFDREGPAGLRRGKQIEGACLKARHVLKRTTRESIAEMTNKTAPPFHACKRDIRRQGQFRHGEAWCIRITQDKKRIERAPEPTAEEARLRRTAPALGGDVGHRHEWDDVRLGR